MRLFEVTFAVNDIPEKHPEEMSDKELGYVVVIPRDGHGTALEQSTLQTMPLGLLQATWAYYHKKRKPELKRVALLTAEMILRKVAKTTEEPKEDTRNIVWRRDEYEIGVNNKDDATYIVCWYNDGKRPKQIGFISTRSHTGGRKDYLGIRLAELEPKHRNKRLGIQMYRVLLAHLAPKWKGIASYLPDRLNKKQIPRIYKSLGGWVEEDYAYANRTN